MRIDLNQFPNSKNDPFLITSPATPNYNCIAWAFGDDTKWYWPDISNMYFWPNNISRKENIESFVDLFKLIGFEECENGDLDPEYLKVAIFVDNFDKPTHAARQLENGNWTSKLGSSHDVSHSILSMEGGLYGNISVYMKKKK